MCVAAADAEDDLPTSRTLLSQCVADDPETIINNACITYKEGKYDEARAAFTEALNTSGYHPALAYNVALCFYATKQYGAAATVLAGACLLRCLNAYRAGERCLQ